MSEIAFCNRGVTPLVEFAQRHLDPACTPRVIQQRTCPLTAFDNATIPAGAQLLFSGSSPRVMGFAALTYDALRQDERERERETRERERERGSLRSLTYDALR